MNTKCKSGSETLRNFVKIGLDRYEGILKINIRHYQIFLRDVGKKTFFSFSLIKEK